MDFVANILQAIFDRLLAVIRVGGLESFQIFLGLLVALPRNFHLGTAAKLVGFLKWAMKDGQKLAQPLNYAPLPKTLVAKVEKKIATIEVKKTP